MKYFILFLLLVSCPSKADLNLKAGDIIVLRDSASGNYCSDKEGRMHCDAKSIGSVEQFLVKSYKLGRLAWLVLQVVSIVRRAFMGLNVNLCLLMFEEKLIIQTLKDGYIALRGGKSGRACINKKGLKCESLEIGEKKKNLNFISYVLGVVPLKPPII